MGLFKRRQQTNEELEAMREELRSLRARLEQTDGVRNRLTERMGHLDAENERLNRQVGLVESRVGEVATKIGSVEHDVVTVAGSIGPTVDEAVRTAVEGTADGRFADLRSRLDELAAALQRQQGQIADVALVATDAAERSEQTESKRQVGQLAEKVSSLDSRIHQVSLELTNQLTELSSDLDQVGEQADTGALIERINTQLSDMTGGQERLANEQARYAIQFRNDLAELADRLRRN